MSFARPSPPPFVPSGARLEHLVPNILRIGGPGSGVSFEIDREMLAAVRAAALYYPHQADNAEWVRDNLDSLARILDALLPSHAPWEFDP